MKLRPYQQEAITAILESIQTQQFSLLQAPTGAGKTVIFSALVKELMAAYDMRVLILAHRELLITQTAQRMREVWPDVSLSLACASAGEVDFSGSVVIGSVQTVSKRVNQLPLFHMVIIDEAHRLQPRGTIDKEGLVSGTDSSYNTVLERLISYLPTVRVLGVTATPFRLGHGYIYGDKCRPGIANWFPDITYQISMKRLIGTGALVPFGGLVAGDPEDVKSVKRNSNGDFLERQLSDVMCRSIHLDAAANAYIEHGENRRGVVFCVDIKHAEALEERFYGAGIICAAIHSKMSAELRAESLRAFEAGEVKVLINVGILTEGWDCPQVDLIMFARPTLAPALYIQMLGRGLRPCEGKSNCMIIDLVGNYVRHGHPDYPTVKIPTGRDSDDGMSEYDDEPLPSERSCDKCNVLVNTRAWVCPDCGHILIPQSDIPTLRQLKLDGTIARTDELAEITGHQIDEYKSRAGNNMLRLHLAAKSDKRRDLVDVFLYPDFSGGQAMRWRAWWESTIRTPAPRSNQEALTREWNLPAFMTIRRDGNYWKVGTWIHA